MRGPFEGTWAQGNRPTVVTAPDALVYINGETDIIGCTSCQRRFDFNKYITSLQVDLHVDSVPGSANISLSIPRHTIDEFYFEGDPLISPMMEVEIFAKGYFLVEGLPQYYPIFWGLITEVSDNYSGGAHSISLNCADILKWWELCKMNINPAFTQAGGQLGRSIFGNVLFGSNPYDMIWTLAQQSFGDVVVGSGSLLSLYKEGVQKQTFNAALGDIMAYWQARFAKIRSNLLLYGTQGNAVRGDVLYQSYQTQGGAKKFTNSKAVPFASQAVRQANGGKEGSQMVFDPTDPAVTAFRTQFSQAGQVNFWSSEFQSKLEIANACKDAIGYEFFMDVTGDIVFKPPFYNLDVLGNKPVSWIQDIDIIEWDFSESEAEVVTQLQLSGSFGGNIDYGMPEEVTPTTSVTDYHLLRKYGWRTQTFNSEFSGSTIQMFYIGLDMLDRMNSRRHRGSIGIPLRPELRLGFPIYLAPKDQVWYVTGISHNIQFGSRAQTTLTVSSKRVKFIAPQGIGSLKLTGYSGGGKGAPAKSASASLASGYTTSQLAAGGQFTAKIGDAAQIPPTNAPTSTSVGGSNPYEPLILRHPKTGRILGYPNVVMAYTKPFVDPTSTDFTKVAGQKDPATQKRVVTAQRKTIEDKAPSEVLKFSTEAHSVQTKDKLREKYLTNRTNFGLNSAGVFTYLYESTQAIKEMILLPKANLKFDSATDKLALEGTSAMIRPVSDERGFEVIGHFRYGRGVALRDGSLLLSESGTNTAAQVSFQLAMSGGLVSTLQTQSQGLITGAGISANPAATLASLSPDDLQSAAAINPDTKQPEFVSTGNNLVSTAPLGSAQQAGSTATNSTATVEAAQLSRALTLAEMNALQEVSPDAECDCLLGRADLAFIAEGYQLNVIGASSPASTGSAAENASRAQAAALQSGLNSSVAAATANAPPDQLVQTALEAIGAFQQEHQQEIDSLEVGILQNFSNAPTAGSAPVADSSVMLSHSDVIGKVESFLTTLYQALDTSHQQLEAGLRGDALGLPQNNPEDIRFGLPESLENMAPPFNAGFRSVNGDPIAAASQAVDDLNTAASNADDLGAALQADIQRGELQAQINALTHSIDTLETKINSEEELGIEVDPGDKKALDDQEQQLMTLQQKLNVLNQTYPP